MNQDFEENKEKLLGKQATTLDRLLKQSAMTVSELANRLGVERQTIYHWLRGSFYIPEKHLKELGVIFHKDPCEIRYDIELFNPRDLKTVVMIVERELNKRNLNISSEYRATLIANLYSLFQNQKRLLHCQFHESSFKQTAEDVINLALSGNTSEH